MSDRNSSEKLNEKEIDRSKWSNYRNIKVPKNLFEESLSVLNSIDNNLNDIVNWEERKELDKVAKRNPNISVKDDNDNDYYKELINQSSEIIKSMEEINGRK
jgi:hypothetical protein